MDFCRTALLAAAFAAVALTASPAGAQTLPETRTHVDPAEVLATPAGTPDADAPRIELIRAATTAASVRQGYLAVLLRCDVRCRVDVTAHARIGGRSRLIAATSKTLPGGRTRKLKLRIHSDVRRHAAAGGLTYEFRAVPYAPAVR